MLIETTAQTPGPAPGLTPIRRRFAAQICLVLLMITVVLSGFLFISWNQQTAIDLRESGRQARIAQEALMEAQAFGHVFPNRQRLQFDLQALIASRRPTMHARPVDGVRLLELMCIISRLNQWIEDDGEWKMIAESE